MACCVIFKKDLEKLGKELMKEFYFQIHSDYLLGEFEELKLKRKYYDENITKEFLSFCKEKEKITKIQNLYFSNKKLKDLVEMENEDLLKEIENLIEKETLNYEVIFNFLDQMDKKLEINKNVDFVIDEDLFCMKKAFIHLYLVYHFDHDYLE